MHMCPDCGKSHNRPGWAFYMLCIECARAAMARQESAAKLHAEQNRSIYFR